MLPQEKVSHRSSVCWVRWAIGKSPFLCTIYGNSELPQAFCRMCAVYGGIYMLRVAPRALCIGKPVAKVAEEGGIRRRHAEADPEHIQLIDTEADVCNGLILSDGQRIHAKHVALAAEYLSNEGHTPSSRDSCTNTKKAESRLLVCRCILITTSQFRGTPAEAGGLWLWCLQTTKQCEMKPPSSQCRWTRMSTSLRSHQTIL